MRGSVAGAQPGLQRGDLATPCPVPHLCPWPLLQVAEPACLDYLKRAGGPRCGPAQGGATCGDRVATFIICECGGAARKCRVLPAPTLLPPRPRRLEESHPRRADCLP